MTADNDKHCGDDEKGTEPLAGGEPFPKQGVASCNSEHWDEVDEEATDRRG